MSKPAEAESAHVFLRRSSQASLRASALCSILTACCWLRNLLRIQWPKLPDLSLCGRLQWPRDATILSKAAQLLNARVPSASAGKQSWPPQLNVISKSGRQNEATLGARHIERTFDLRCSVATLEHRTFRESGLLHI